MCLRLLTAEAVECRMATTCRQTARLWRQKARALVARPLRPPPPPPRRSAENRRERGAGEAVLCAGERALKLAERRECSVQR
eukprot:scaffold254447_cov28-Tisochrysis_lutea.AAC.3